MAAVLNYEHNTEPFAVVGFDTREGLEASIRKKYAGVEIEFTEKSFTAWMLDFPDDVAYVRMSFYKLW